MSVEVETHHHEANDPISKAIGLQTAIIAILLSIFTILSHRTHTDTIVMGNEASSTWAHYQAKRIRAYQIEMNTGLIKLLAPNSSEVSQTLSTYAKEAEKYKEELVEIKGEGDHLQAQEKIAHHKASYFDLAEGLLDIAMVLSSLFFLSKKRIFPSLGLFLGIVGVIVGLIGVFLTH